MTAAVLKRTDTPAATDAAATASTTAPSSCRVCSATARTLRMARTAVHTYRQMPITAAAVLAVQKILFRAEKTRSHQRVDEQNGYTKLLASCAALLAAGSANGLLSQRRREKPGQTDKASVADEDVCRLQRFYQRSQIPEKRRELDFFCSNDLATAAAAPIAVATVTLPGSFPLLKKKTPIAKKAARITTLDNTGNNSKSKLAAADAVAFRRTTEALNQAFSCSKLGKPWHTNSLSHTTTEKNQSFSFLSGGMKKSNTTRATLHALSHCSSRSPLWRQQQQAAVSHHESMQQMQQQQQHQETRLLSVDEVMRKVAPAVVQIYRVRLPHSPSFSQPQHQQRSGLQSLQRGSNGYNCSNIRRALFSHSDSSREGRRSPQAADVQYLGSGFIFSAEGAVLTAAHLFDEGRLEKGCANELADASHAEAEIDRATYGDSFGGLIDEDIASPMGETSAVLKSGLEDTLQLASSPQRKARSQWCERKAATFSNSFADVTTTAATQACAVAAAAVPDTATAAVAVSAAGAAESAGHFFNAATSPTPQVPTTTSTTTTRRTTAIGSAHVVAIVSIPAVQTGPGTAQAPPPPRPSFLPASAGASLCSESAAASTAKPNTPTTSYSSFIQFCAVGEGVVATTAAHACRQSPTKSGIPSEATPTAATGSRTSAAEAAAALTALFQRSGAASTAFSYSGTVPLSRRIGTHTTVFEVLKTNQLAAFTGAVDADFAFASSTANQREVDTDAVDFKETAANISTPAETEGRTAKRMNTIISTAAEPGPEDFSSIAKDALTEAIEDQAVLRREAPAVEEVAFVSHEEAPFLRTAEVSVGRDVAVRTAASEDVGFDLSFPLQKHSFPSPADAKPFSFCSSSFSPFLSCQVATSKANPLHRSSYTGEASPAVAPANNCCYVVKLADHRLLCAKLQGRSLEADVAVLQLQLRSGEALPSVNMHIPVGLLAGPEYERASSLLRPLQGEAVVAYGIPQHADKPVGVTGTVSQPLQTFISADVGKSIGFIQLAVTTLPGMSGSPVCNMRGQVVGMMVKKFQESGLALPSHFIMRVAEQLMTSGIYTPPSLGLIFLASDVKRSIAEFVETRYAYGTENYKDLCRDSASSLSVDNVIEGSPAQRSGLQRGDRLLCVDGFRIQHVEELFDVVAARAPGESVKLRVARGPRTLDVTAILGRKMD